MCIYIYILLLYYSGNNNHYDACAALGGQAPVEAGEDLDGLP